MLTEPPAASATGFYAEMRREADPIFEAIFRHPMVVELCAGSLAEDKWAYYLAQDYQYLRDFKQALGLCLSHLETPREIFQWIDRIASLADLEAARHLTWARRLGLSQHDLLAAQPGPGELLAAQTPCPTTYTDIADRAADRVPDHPTYGEWVRSYSSRLN